MGIGFLPLQSTRGGLLDCRGEFNMRLFVCCTGERKSPAAQARFVRASFAPHEGPTPPYGPNITNLNPT